MLSSPDLEIRTRSVPTAGHLLALGFEPLGIVTHPSGTKTFRFSPDARQALERFLLAKQRLDFPDTAGTNPSYRRPSDQGPPTAWLGTHTGASLPDREADVA